METRRHLPRACFEDLGDASGDDPHAAPRLQQRLEAVPVAGPEPSQPSNDVYHRREEERRGNQQVEVVPQQALVTQGL